jgi:hypothetical protein
MKRFALINNITGEVTTTLALSKNKIENMVIDTILSNTEIIFIKKYEIRELC